MCANIHVGTGTPCGHAHTSVEHQYVEDVKHKSQLTAERSKRHGNNDAKMFKKVSMI
jgi:hypothetical protein